METTTYPMYFTWKMCFWMLAGVGAVAVVAGVGRLLGLEQFEMTEVEAWTAIGVGIALQPFAWTAHAHARLELDGEELRFLRFGFLCSTGQIALTDIARFGVGRERGANATDEKILRIELHDGARHSIKLSMYERNGQFVERLGEATGQSQAGMQRTWKGAEFSEDA